MTDPVWHPEEAARLLAEVYGGSLGDASDIDPLTQEELARAGRRPGVPGGDVGSVGGPDDPGRVEREAHRRCEGLAGRGVSWRTRSPLTAVAVQLPEMLLGVTV